MSCYMNKRNNIIIQQIIIRYWLSIQYDKGQMNVNDVMLRKKIKPTHFSTSTCCVEMREAKNKVRVK